jgi:hypothetical protein
MSIETGGPAFPAMNERQTGNNDYRYEGMTLRDYFAAAALTGILANPDGGGPYHREAEYAYLYADAMLRARGEG